jgi:hypothetical protein
VNIYKTKAFERFARKEPFSAASLRDAVAAALAKPDASLGGEVIKQRVARDGKGKSGGYRTIILLRKGTRAVFVHGFAKNDKDNITPDELKGFKALAKWFLNLTEAQITKLIDLGELIEVEHADDEEEDEG